MWKSILYLAIFGNFVFGQNPWKPNQEYTYDIYTRTLTALPELRNQYVGVVTKGKLILQSRADGQLLGKLIKIIHANYHGDLEDGVDSRIPEEQLEFQSSELNNKPFIVETRNGVIQSILVDESMTNDQVNQVKGILSQLQVDIQGENLIKCKHNQLPENNEMPIALYKTMEPTVTGQCETAYDMQPLPRYMAEIMYPQWAPKIEINTEDDLFQIVKTSNFNNCRVRKGYHFGITAESNLKPNTNQMGDFLSKLSIGKVIASGSLSNYTIQNSQTINRVAVRSTLHQEQKVEVVSQIQVALSSLRSISKSLNEPQNPIDSGDLVYRYNVPSDKENRVREGSNLLKSEMLMAQSTRNVMKTLYKTNMMRTQKHLMHNPDAFPSSESLEESKTANEHQFQPKPDMQNAPELPMQPFTVGNKGRSIQFYNEINIEEETRNLVKEIAKDLQDQDKIAMHNTLEKFNILTDILRTLNVQQIWNVTKHLEIDHSESESLSKHLTHILFQDGVAQAGTGPAVSVVTKWISDGKVRGHDAVDLINTLSRSIRTPTAEIIKVIFDLMKQETMRRQRNVYSSAILSFSELVGRAHDCMNSGYNYYPVESFGHFCMSLENIVTETILPYFSQRLHEAVEQKNAQNILLNIRALGNIAHPNIIGIYEKYLEESNQLTRFERTSMILSLDVFTIKHSRIARKILYKVYANVAEEPETRAAAVHLLMRANPTAEMLYRMAEYTHEDPSEAVQAVVKSAILSASELKDPSSAELARKAASAKKFLNPRKYGLQYSTTYLHDYMTSTSKSTYKQHLGQIVGHDYSRSQSLLYTSYKNLEGFVSKQADVQVMISNTEELFRMLTTNLDENKSEMENNSGEFSADSRAKEMDSEQRKHDLEGQVLFDIMGLKRFWTFDQKTLKELPRHLSVVSTLIKGHQLKYNKIYNWEEVEIAFPLASGYPFVYTYRKPIMMQAIGAVQMKTLPELLESFNWESLRSAKAYNLSANVKLTFSNEEISKAGFIAPFEMQQYVAGYTRKSQVHVPLNIRIDIDMNKHALFGKLTPINNDKDFIAYHASAWPYTVRVNALNLRPMAEVKDLKLIKSQQIKKIERTIGERTSGLVFNMEMEHELNSPEWTNSGKLLEMLGMMSLSNLPLSYQTLIQRISERRLTSPFSFQSGPVGFPERQVLLSLAVLPFINELSTQDILRAEGMLSLITLPFENSKQLRQTVKHEGMLPVGNFPWPLRSLNSYNFNFKYDSQRSSNQIVKFQINFDRIYKVNGNTRFSERVRGPASVDEQTLIYPSNIEANSEERRLQHLENSAHDFRDASVSVFDASITFDGKQRVEYVATITHAQNSVNDKERVMAYFRSSPIEKEWTRNLCVVYTEEHPLHSRLNVDATMKGNSQSTGRMNIAFGKDCQTDATKVTLKTIREQTPEFKEYISNSSYGQQCKQEMKSRNYQVPSCLTVEYYSNFFNRVRISGEVENVTPEVRNFTRRAILFARHLNFWNYEEYENIEPRNPGVFEATVDISPDLKRMNTSIYTEKLTYIFNNVNINERYLEMFKKSPEFMGYASQIWERNPNENACVFEQNRMLTFDNKDVKEKIGKCWHTILQYNARTYKKYEHNISVLLRESPLHSSEKKELMISVRDNNNNKYVYHLRSENTGIRVKMNGEEMQITKDEGYHVCEMVENNKCKRRFVDIYEVLPGEMQVNIRGNMLRIHFNGERVKIYASPVLRNRLVGLCGNYNGEKVDDLVTPNKCYLRNEKLWTVSWALTENESCSIDVKKAKTKADQSECYPVNTKQRSTNIISNYEAGRHYQDKETKNWLTQWSASSSSSSSSEESHTELKGKTGPKPPKKNCNLKEQVQYIEQDGRICFSITPLPACPAHCKVTERTQEQSPVHCRDMNDSVAQMYKQQIHKGITPDFSKKRVSMNIKFNVPTTCAAMN